MYLLLSSTFAYLPICLPACLKKYFCSYFPCRYFMRLTTFVTVAVHQIERHAAQAKMIEHFH